MARLPTIDNEVTLSSQLELGGRVSAPAAGRLALPSAQMLAALAALLASASAVTLVDGLDWTPDRMLLVFLAPALVLRRARRYLLDFVPF
ncbi:MAG TPA: hypothetical protein VFV85_07640, partial [Conexibacter sp.]|nr:hypothetical protein [Conexibacter sp.]